MDQNRQNNPGNKEQAEGSRENVGGGAAGDSGITNRPIEQEEREQQQVPPRGERKDEDAGRTS